MNMLESNTNFM